MKKIATFLTGMFLVATVSVVPASAVVRPTGMIVRDSAGAYFYTYSTPGTNYADKRLKYIGHGEVLDYYLSRGRQAYQLSDSEKAGYTIHNHNLRIPCGEVARDADGRIAFYEPLAGTGDQGDAVFSYAENFPYYVGSLNPNHSGISVHYPLILQRNPYVQMKVIDGLPDNVEGGIYPWGVPNCVIVKQTGTPNYYRVFRHRTNIGQNIQRKALIPNVERLNYWLNFNSYTYEADITALPEIGRIGLPPGMLVRELPIFDATSTVYFIDDEGYKVRIPSQEIFDQLGFSPNDVTFVGAGVLGDMATRNIY